jgi:ferritin-like metal-binding protein YciE
MDEQPPQRLRKTFKYKLTPTPEQARQLEQIVRSISQI